MKYQRQRILVVGLGKSGLATVRYLLRQGADVIATDIKKAEELGSIPEDLGRLNVFAEFGGHNRHTFLTSDMIVLSPGINPQTPLIREAVNKGVHIVNEPELAFREITAPVIAITGSNGKTTTTELVGEILKSSGRKVAIAGNIGTPLLSLNLGESWDCFVVELSSYQLELIQSLRPAVAVFTNVSPNQIGRAHV